jgi:hypothetical protein
MNNTFDGMESRMNAMTKNLIAKDDGKSDAKYITTQSPQKGHSPLSN